MDCSRAKCYSCNCQQGHISRILTNWAISPPQHILVYHIMHYVYLVNIHTNRWTSGYMTTSSESHVERMESRSDNACIHTDCQPPTCLVEHAEGRWVSNAPAMTRNQLQHYQETPIPSIPDGAWIYVYIHILCHVCTYHAIYTYIYIY